MRFFTALLAAFVIWSVTFAALYATHATGCEMGWSTSQLRWLLTAIGTLGMVAMGWIALRLRGAPDVFRYVTYAAIASGAATFPLVMILPPC